MLADAQLTFGEFVANPHPSLAEVFRVVFEYLQQQPAAVLFGSQAVNAYVTPPRMTEDVDIMSTDAKRVAEEIRSLLAKTFRIAVRVRVVAHGLGFRVYQLRKPKNRHLVDLRQVDALPRTSRIIGVRVVGPSDLIVLKLASYAARRHTEKGMSDKLDLVRLLRRFPALASDDSGPVVKKILSDAPLLNAWYEILSVSKNIEPSDDDAY